MFFASIESSGFSFAKGSGRTFFDLSKLGGGVVRPPVYAGMVPSLLPAFSAPNGVSSAPSFLASSAVTAACAGAAWTDSTPAQINAAARCLMVCVSA
jgi:hypothetical protein